DCAGRLQIINTELRTRFALLRRPEGREALHVASLVEELGEAPLEVVVGSDVVEDRPLRFQGRKIAPPAERACLGQLKVRPVELDRTSFDGQFRDLPGEIL